MVPPLFFFFKLRFLLPKFTRLFTQRTNELSLPTSEKKEKREHEKNRESCARRRRRREEFRVRPLPLSRRRGDNERFFDRERGSATRCCSAAAFSFHGRRRGKERFDFREKKIQLKKKKKKNRVPLITMMFGRRKRLACERKRCAFPRAF